MSDPETGILFLFTRCRPTQRSYASARYRCGQWPTQRRFYTAAAAATVAAAAAAAAAASEAGVCRQDGDL